MKADLLQNGKTDTNNNGAFSTDYIGGSYDYPEGSYATRATHLAGARRLHPGLPVLPRQRPARPAGAAAEMKTWGLCRDEFVDTDHWPHQLYVREARRMVGEYVMSQKDIQTELTKPDAIGMGSYNSDSHNVQRRPTADGRRVENEGDMQVAVTPYQIPVPRACCRSAPRPRTCWCRSCFSATHVAYSTLRMEPQYMILGQAAGVAAKMAIDSKAAVQDIDVTALQTKLKSQRAVFALPPP